MVRDSPAQGGSEARKDRILPGRRPAGQTRASKTSTSACPARSVSSGPVIHRRCMETAFQPLPDVPPAFRRRRTEASAARASQRKSPGFTPFSVTASSQARTAALPEPRGGRESPGTGLKSPSGRGVSRTAFACARGSAEKDCQTGEADLGPGVRHLWL